MDKYLFDEWAAFIRQYLSGPRHSTDPTAEFEVKNPACTDRPGDQKAHFDHGDRVCVDHLRIQLESCDTHEDAIARIEQRMHGHADVCGGIDPLPPE